MNLVATHKGYEVSQNPISGSLIARKEGRPTFINNAYGNEKYLIQDILKKIDESEAAA